jgi:FtsX extracellular domain
VSRRPLAGGLVALALFAAGCGGSGSADGPRSVVQSPAPNFQAFLRLPVATPSACPPSQNGTTIGRTSVWSGQVDLSVYVATSTTPREAKQVGATLRADPRVRTVYYETPKQAYEEFQRLYTCWAGVARSQIPSSYRVDLNTTVTIAERDALVSTVARLPHVDYVACNPVIPCTSSLPTPSATPAA